MASGENHSYNKALLFNGTNYAFWQIRMETFLKALGFDIWMLVKNGYTPAIEPITEPAVEKKKFENDSKANNALLSGLVDSKFVRVMGCEFAKDVWDKLKSVHEGDAKIKEAKLQHYRAQFEGLKMSEKEIVEAYLLRVNETVNSIRAHGEKLKETVVVKRVLRSLPAKYNPKVSAIEEAKDLDTLSLDEVHGSLTAYGMRIGKEKSTKKEAAFKALKNLKIKQESDDEDSEDELIANLCPNKEKHEDEEEEDAQESSRSKKNKKKFFPKRGKTNRRSLISKKNDSSSNEFDDDSDESDEALFMAFTEVTQDTITIASENEEEGEINLEGELLSALSDLKDKRKKTKNLIKQLGEANEMIIQLKVAVEESKKMTEDLMISLSSKNDKCIFLEEQSMLLGAELDELKKVGIVFTTPQTTTFARSNIEIANTHLEVTSCQDMSQSNDLDEILSSQRPTHIKFGLGFEPGNSSKIQNTKGKGIAQVPVKFVQKKHFGTQSRRRMNVKPSKEVDRDILPELLNRGSLLEIDISSMVTAIVVMVMDTG
ncbi:uncharacterized protein LOC122655345 [Telopea speciosissima]|uniref:uncharacterized protein LOC122655345 n=1 Tax=Telopea speciosissima TaxID=54955 RepID=UPI001CC41C8E|nr:uncharacterized protein LOC122655345 [Telopea speciosissima]